VIGFVIGKPRVEDDPLNPGKFWIQHPANGAILAYCSTADEANMVAFDLEELGRKYEAIAKSRERRES
jgi:hypothetical protein